MWIACKLDRWWSVLPHSHRVEGDYEMKSLANYYGGISLVVASTAVSIACQLDNLIFWHTNSPPRSAIAFFRPATGLHTSYCQLHLQKCADWGAYRESPPLPIWFPSEAKYRFPFSVSFYCFPSGYIKIKKRPKKLSSDQPVAVGLAVMQLSFFWEIRRSYSFGVGVFC